MIRPCVQEGRASGRDARQTPVDFVFLTRSSERLRGLLFRRPDDAVRVLVPCRSVHTAGMKHALDVAFLDGEGTVLAAYRKVGRRRCLRCSGARMTLERFATDEPWFRVGERVGLMPRAKG